jgi:hypothetical protein
MMKELRLQYPIPVMARVLTVSASGYHRWVKRPPSKIKQQDGRLEAEIRAAHTRGRKSYGPERIQDDLSKHGIAIGVHTIKRIRKTCGIKCVQTKKFKCTTDSYHFAFMENFAGYPGACPGVSGKVFHEDSI